MKNLLKMVMLSGIVLVGEAICMDSKDNNARNNSRGQLSETVLQVLSIHERLMNASGEEQARLREEVRPQLEAGIADILSGNNVSQLEQVIGFYALEIMQRLAAAANAPRNNAAAQANPVQNVRYMLANTYMGDPEKNWRPLREEDLGFRTTLLGHCQPVNIAEHNSGRNFKISLNDFRALVNYSAETSEYLREINRETMIIVPDIAWEGVRLDNGPDAAHSLHMYTCPLSTGMTDLVRWFENGDHIRYSSVIRAYSEDRARMLREAGIDAEIEVSSDPEKRCFINFINLSENEVINLMDAGVVLKFTDAFRVVHVFEED